MREHEQAYKEQLENMHERIDSREPLFRVSEVKAAFSAQKQRSAARKNELAQEEHKRWQHLRNVERNAANSKLLIDGGRSSFTRLHAYRSEPNLATVGEEASRRRPSTSSTSSSSKRSSSSGLSGFSEREEYPSDLRLQNAVSRKWFRESGWGEKVREIQEKTSN